MKQHLSTIEQTEVDPFPPTDFSTLEVDNTTIIDLENVRFVVQDVPNPFTISLENPDNDPPSPENFNPLESNAAIVQPAPTPQQALDVLTQEHAMALDTIKKQTLELSRYKQHNLTLENQLSTGIVYFIYSYYSGYKCPSLDQGALIGNLKGIIKTTVDEALQKFELSFSSKLSLEMSAAFTRFFDIYFTCHLFCLYPQR